MTDGKSAYWPGADERVVVDEMTRDRQSKHWEECCKFVARRVYAKARNIPKDLQEEVAQEVMYRVAKHLAGFGFRCALKTWLNLLVEHCTIDVHRQLQKRGGFVSLDETLSELDGEGEICATSQGTENIAVAKEELRIAITLLLEYANAHSHPDRDKQIIQLVIFEAHNYAETALLVDCNPPVVGYVIREAKRYVRENMGYKL